MTFRRNEKLPPSTEPMQAMVDAGMLTDPPDGLIRDEARCARGEIPSPENCQSCTFSLECDSFGIAREVEAKS